MTASILKPSWTTITVGQFQRIKALDSVKLADDTDDIDKLLHSLDRMSNIIGVLYDLDIDAVDNLTAQEYARLSRTCDFLNDAQVPGKPVRSFKAEGKRYHINYKPLSLTSNDHLLLAELSVDPITDLHKIMAVIVGPKGITQGPAFEALANTMKAAPFAAVYHAMLYYLRLLGKMVEAVGERVTEGHDPNTQAAIKQALQAADIQLKDFAQ